MPIVAAPKSLRDKLGDEALESFIQLLNEVEKGARETSVLLVEERFERKLTEVKTDLENKIVEVKADLENKIAGVKIDLENKITQVKADLENKIAEVKVDLERKIIEFKTDLENKIAGVKIDLIKWMFIFWIGQVGTILGILALTGVFSK
jgi:copper chaperone CopZ